MGLKNADQSIHICGRPIVQYTNNKQYQTQNDIVLQQLEWKVVISTKLLILTIVPPGLEVICIEYLSMLQGAELTDFR